MREDQGRRRDLLWALARQARREPTPAEKTLWEMLRNHRCGGLGFRRQVIVGPFRLDFYCPAKKLAIEVDGRVHGDSDVQQRDRERQSILETDFGIRFVRVSNEDVLKHPNNVLARIFAAGSAKEQ